MKRSDSAFSIALCASLLVHATLGLLVLREKLAELQVRRVAVARVDRDIDKPDPDKVDQSSDETLAVVIQPAPLPPPEFKPAAPPPPSSPVAQKPKDTNDENLEWGEKNAKGFAITSAPGEQPMSARKGAEDQSFASRDPEGPDRFPDDPSMSTVAPGENGDGRKPLRDALAGKGTEGNPTELLNKAAAPATPPPPPPVLERTVIASADPPFKSPQTSGRSSSQMPTVERRSPAEANSPPGERDEMANDPATGAETQILPIKRVDVIGIQSNKPAYPEVVLALTQPPGVRIAKERRDPLVETVLANVVTADVPRSPTIQAATAAISVKAQPIEEMARLLGEADPLNGLVVVEALTRPPGAEALEGGDAALPEIARADRPDAAEAQDAIMALSMDAPRPAEPAQQFELAPPTPQAVAAANTGATGSAARATGGAVGPATPAADPAPDTGFESDPFAKIPGVEFKSGKVEARSGRQIKPIRPRLTEAGMRDLLAQQFPTVLAKVRIDKTGKVVDVHIVRGSGSEAVDMPVYRALWGWWFEPPTDMKGNPLEDVQLVAIHWG